jgi:hypothetical protein
MILADFGAASTLVPQAALASLGWSQSTFSVSSSPGKWSFQTLKGVLEASEGSDSCPSLIYP